MNIETATLDEVVLAFRASPSAYNAECLITVATEYHADGMIEEGTRDLYMAEALSAL